MIVIDTSVWIPLLNGAVGAKVELARQAIEGPEDIGIPGIILEEILRGFRADAQFRQIRDLLLTDFGYLEVTRACFLRSAEIYRTLRKRGQTVRSTADCLIAACVLEERATLIEDDEDFRTIARAVPLMRIGHA